MIKFSVDREWLTGSTSVGYVRTICNLGYIIVLSANILNFIHYILYYLYYIFKNYILYFIYFFKIFSI